VILFPNAKINLGLNIIRKRADGYHDLETVFYPIAILDALEVIQKNEAGKDVQLSLSGIAVAGAAADNLCIKAYQLLKKDFPQLPPVKIHLHKSIPAGGGLGGGSSDGAFMLKLLSERFSGSKCQGIFIIIFREVLGIQSISCRNIKQKLFTCDLTFHLDYINFFILNHYY